MDDDEMTEGSPSMTPETGRPGDLTDRDLDALLDLAVLPVPEPSLALLNRILADAAEVSGSAPAARPQAAPAAGIGRRLAAWLTPVGGWRGAAALAGCAAFGVWLGISGEESLSLQFTSGVDAAALESFDSSADAIFAFYELASADG